MRWAFKIPTGGVELRMLKEAYLANYGVKNPAAELRGIEQQSLKDLIEVDQHAEA